jgi:hypothetical protein
MRDEASEAAHTGPTRLPETAKAGSASNKDLRALWRRREEAEDKLRQRVEASRRKPGR